MVTKWKAKFAFAVFRITPCSISLITIRLCHELQNSCKIKSGNWNVNVVVCEYHFSHDFSCFIVSNVLKQRKKPKAEFITYFPQCYFPIPISDDVELLVVYFAMIELFSALLHWHLITLLQFFIKTGPGFVGFRCCKMCFCTLEFFKRCSWQCPFKKDTYTIDSVAKL